MASVSCYYGDMKEMIVAYGKKREIGRNGDMPWGRDLPADLLRFRDLTLGKSAIMGLHTHRSIGRALPGRENIVVTSHDDVSAGVRIARSLDEAYDMAAFEPIVIGGAQLYAAALASIDLIYATEIFAKFPGSDTFFPNLADNFMGTIEEACLADGRNKYDWQYVSYRPDPFKQDHLVIGEG